MRLSLALVAIAACGGHATAPSAPAAPTPQQGAPGFPATRWVPEHPTYLVTAPTVHDFQQTVRAAIDAAGAPVGRQAADVSRALTALLSFDPLSPDAASAAGIDPDSSIAIFSEDLDPTLAVHLTAPDKARALLAKLPATSWSIEPGDWLLVHAGAAPDWLAHSRAATSLAWLPSFEWARSLADRAKSGASKVIGFVDPRALIDRLQGVAGPALACVRVIEPIRRIGLSFDGDLQHVSARAALDVGAKSADIQRATLPPPPGWNATFGAAPISAQFNLDLDSFQDWIQPCADLADINLRDARREGVRAFRIAVTSVEPDGPWGTGAISLEQHGKGPVATLLDRIPGRSHFESDRKFGALDGHRIKIPFKGTIDYVLDDHQSLLALGDGTLDHVTAAAAPAPPPPPISIDLRPPAMPEQAWTFLLELANAPKPIVHALLAWSSIHVGLALDHDVLAVELLATRK